MLKDSGLSHGIVHVVYILDFFKDRMQMPQNVILEDVFLSKYGNFGVSIAACQKPCNSGKSIITIFLRDIHFTSLKTNMALENHHFLVGNTSSNGGFHCHVSLPEGGRFVGFSKQFLCTCLPQNLEQKIQFDAYFFQVMGREQPTRSYMP